MERLFTAILLLIACIASPAAGQALKPPDAEPSGMTSGSPRGTTWSDIDDPDQIFYALERAVVFSAPDSADPYVEIQAREPVRLLRQSPVWAEVQTMDGAKGFVSRFVLSNLWIRVSKRSKTVWLHRGAEVDRALPADMAYNFFLDKERRGSNVEPDHWRTPEGLYYVVARNDQSRFYKALVLNYPSADDARKGLSAGLISEHEYYAILEADQRREAPPMNTSLGGWIEIHGEGTGARTMWTRGCVAVTNKAIDDLWDVVPLGTPVLIEP